MPPCNGSQRDPSPTCVCIIVMGVSGTGKSTLGIALAKALDMPYVEGDELHPRSNVEKMSSGQPLTDTDREPWLELIYNTAENMTVGKLAEKRADALSEESCGVVISCSALKKYYRDILRGIVKPTARGQEIPHRCDTPPPLNALRTYFVFIDGSRDVLKERMEKRAGHFMKVSMLDSQLRTLESPIGEEGVVGVLLEDTTEDQLRAAMAGLSRAGLGLRGH